MRKLRWVVLACLLGFVVGCKQVEVPKQSLGVHQTPEAAWAHVLSEHVNDEGQVDFKSIGKQPQALEAYLSVVMKATPRSRPEKFVSKRDQVIYYVNLYNALAMYHAATSGVEPKSLLKFFVTSKFELGGEKINLKDLENKWIRPIGEPRTHFVLNCMVKSCPRLLNSPLSTSNYEAQLDQAAKEFLNSKAHVQVDHDKKKVLVSKILTWYQEDFEATHGSLIQYINAYRKDQVPVTYKLDDLPYDWSLNQSP